MSIASEITALGTNLQNAKSAVTAKGGTVGDTGLAGLASEIATIPGGSPTPPTGPLDPEDVYEQTRPAHWMKMPTPGDEEFYLLLDVPNNIVDTAPIAFEISNIRGWKMELGTTDSAGVFTPDPDLVATGSGGALTVNVPANKWQDRGKAKQLIAKATITEFLPGASNLASLRISTSSGAGALLKHYLADFVGKTAGRTALTGGFVGCKRLVYVKAEGLRAGQSVFSGCNALKSVRAIGTTGLTDLREMFYNCNNLLAIPPLDTSSATNFYRMFSGCNAIAAIPQLDTSSGTNFREMFQNCWSIVTAPQLDTSSATALMDMFNTCYSLTAVPQLNTSSCSAFSNMFSNCSSLISADLTNYDFSVATTSRSLAQMFSSANGGNLTIDFGDTFGSGGLNTTSNILVSQAGTSDTYPCKVRINKTDAMLQIAANASTLFNGNHVYVYVPDALLADYQADAYWSTLGTRLKPMSEWTA